MEKKKIPVALMIAAGMLLYNNTVAAQSLLPTQETSQHQLSFNEALQLLHKGNQSLKIADKGIDIARAERGKLNAFWMPSLQSTGAFVHLSEKIEVKQPLSQFTDPAKDFVHSILPDDKIISSILDQIGTNTLIFPLAPRNLTTVDLTAEWVLFAGGKRIHATKIGNTMIDLARENRAQTDATQRTLLAESYYGLRLAQEIVGVRLESYKALKLHYENALKLESTGMIDKAARLFAQVNMDEALRELEAARQGRGSGATHPQDLAESGDERRHLTFLSLVYQRYSSSEDGVYAGSGHQQLSAQPTESSRTHGQAAGPHRPEWLSAQYRPFRQTNSLLTWHTEQPVAPHHDRGRLHLEPFRRTGTGEANPAITPDTTNPCTRTGESA